MAIKLPGPITIVCKKCGLDFTYFKKSWKLRKCCDDCNKRSLEHSIENRNKVVNLRKSNQSMTLLEIGKLVGVTKERVRQLLNSSGLPVKHVITRVCKVCQSNFSPRKTEPRYKDYCNNCREQDKENKTKAKAKAREVVKECKGCHNEFTVDIKYDEWHNPSYCSRDCYFKYGIKSVNKCTVKSVEVTCRNCKKKFLVKGSKVNRRKKFKNDKGNWFCTRKCMYSFLKNGIGSNWNHETGS